MKTVCESCYGDLIDSYCNSCNKSDHVDFIIFDIKDQLKRIIKKNWSNIQKFKGKIKTVAKTVFLNKLIMY